MASGRGSSVRDKAEWLLRVAVMSLATPRDFRRLRREAHRWLDPHGAPDRSSGANCATSRLTCRAEGFVENAGQPAEFVVGILYRKSCVQGFRSDLARGCWPWAPKGCLKALTAPDQRTKASDSCFFWTAQCSNPAKQLNVDRCGSSL